MIDSGLLLNLVAVSISTLVLTPSLPYVGGDVCERRNNFNACTHS